MFSVHRFQPANRRAFFITILILFFISCETTPSVSDHEKELFTKICVELTVSKIKYSNNADAYKAAIEDIFLRNNTNRDFLDDFLKKISSQPEIQQEVFQAINSQLEKIESLPPDSLKRLWQIR